MAHPPHGPSQVAAPAHQGCGTGGPGQMSVSGGQGVGPYLWLKVCRPMEADAKNTDLQKLEV